MEAFAAELVGVQVQARRGGSLTEAAQYERARQHRPVGGSADGHGDSPGPPDGDWELPQAPLVGQHDGVGPRSGSTTRPRMRGESC